MSNNQNIVMAFLSNSKVFLNKYFEEFFCKINNIKHYYQVNECFKFCGRTSIPTTMKTHRSKHLTIVAEFYIESRNSFGLISIPSVYQSRGVVCFFFYFFFVLFLFVEIITIRLNRKLS